MKINGIDVQGVFEFLPGLEYQRGDLIIYSGNLYRVLATFTGLESDGATPASSALCELYTDQLGDDLITADMVPSIMNKYMSGLSLGGIISFIGNILRIDQLDSYKSTGIYRITYNGTPCLLRVYKISDESVVQEIVDYNTPAMYFRVLEDGRWGGIRVIKSMTEGVFDDYLNSVIEDAKTCFDLTQLIESKRSTYCYELLIPDSNGNYHGGDLKDAILQLIITYRLDDELIQDFLTLDPTSVNDDNQAVRSVGGKIIKISIDLAGSFKLIDTSSNPVDIRIEKVLKLNRK